MTKYNEGEALIEAPLGYGDKLHIKPTDQKLKEDAASLAMQYVQFWLPGEVEITVLLSRPGASQIAYATSAQTRERLLHTLAEVQKQSALMGVMVKDRRSVK